jgi:hypothetical protein
MPSRFSEIDLDKVRTLSIRDRKSKVSVEEFGRPTEPDATVADWVDTLPDLLAARDFRELLRRLESAIRAQREWIVLMGGHVVKTGIAPVLVPMVRARWIRCVAMNGSAAIHDVEIALFGRTSEVVEENLADGSFGMASETASFLNEAAARAQREQAGFGETLGQALLEAKAPFREQSFLAACAESDVPATVHVALGTDIVHQHPSADGAAIGDASLRDFRILAASVSRLQGGVVTNLGSAVLMPEAFLKALTVARNLGDPLDDFTAANFDMIRHYRPLTNVVRRPTAEGGWGADFAGHHEILLPLLAAALTARLGPSSGPSGG